MGQHSIKERTLDSDKIKHHISHLEEKHQALNKQIDTMERTGVYGDLNIEDLKKQRLHLKDEIEANRNKLK